MWWQPKIKYSQKILSLQIKLLHVFHFYDCQLRNCYILLIYSSSTRCKGQKSLSHFKGIDWPFGGGGGRENWLIWSVLVNWRLGVFLSNFKGPLSQDQQKTLGFCTPYGHFTKSHQLRTMNALGHTNSLPWMYAIGPKTPLVKGTVWWNVTLDINTQHPKDFCWSCDEDPFKWDGKKICRAPSLSLRIEWVYSCLSVWMIGQYL